MMQITRVGIIRNISLVLEEMKLDITRDDPLVGRGAVLDSLSFVSFIVAVEQKIGDAFGQKITLANSRAFSQKKNPFETIGSLATYIEELIDGK